MMSRGNTAFEHVQCYLIGLITFIIIYFLEYSTLKVINFTISMYSTLYGMAAKTGNEHADYKIIPL